jgi:serine O-acetyltransferase
MAQDPDFQADLARYPPRAFLREQSIWAIYVYRLGRRLLKRRPGFLRSCLLKLHSILFRVVETITGISLPIEANIGPGLRIYHFGNIFVHPDAVLGRNCTLRQGVTIGNVGIQGPVPVIEDDVEFGAYSQVLGKVRVGNGAKIGVLSVVFEDVPPKATIMGNPGRILRDAKTSS